MTAKVKPDDALRRAFDGLSATIETSSGRAGEDVILRVRVGGRTYRLRPRWVGQGWPSEVKRAVPEAARGWPPDLVVTARRFSPGALALLEQIDANWADEAGQARIIRPPGLLIVRGATPQAEGTRRDEPVRWPPSAVEIGEYVLVEAVRAGTEGLRLRTGELRAQTGWSAAQVSQVLAGFDAAGWTVRHGGRAGRWSWRQLVDPGALLDAWADHVHRQSTKVLRGHRVTADLVRFAHMQLGPALHGRAIEWALTGWAALELLAPFATAVPQLQVYVASEAFDVALPGVLRELGIREVSEGARVEFRAADFRLRRQQAEPRSDPPVWIASLPRVYADLVATGGRAADAAAHLREVKVGF